jgi:hypothetical protein
MVETREKRRQKRHDNLHRAKLCCMRRNSDTARRLDSIDQLLQTRMARQTLLQRSKTRASDVEVPHSEVHTDGYGDRQRHTDEAHPAARARVICLTFGLVKRFLECQVSM